MRSLPLSFFDLNFWQKGFLDGSMVSLTDKRIPSRVETWLFTVREVPQQISQTKDQKVSLCKGESAVFQRFSSIIFLDFAAAMADVDKNAGEKVAKM